MSQVQLTVPAEGEPIRLGPGERLLVPDHPIIPFIEGDGTGPEIWQAAVRVLDAAVAAAYGDRRRLAWMEVFAGEKCLHRYGTWLLDETVEAFRSYRVGIKGPLTTPIGGGIRSLNVALRKLLDLYVCIRPVCHVPGVPSPVHHPELVDMVIFRENTEDLYSGIEFAAGSPESARLRALLQENFPDEYAKIRFPESSGFGLKPISREGSERLVRAALRHALEQGRHRVTLVHKGNIMKYTEGAFRGWGFALAEREFGDRVYTTEQFERARQARGEDAARAERDAALAAGRVLVNDIIADIAFQHVLTQPQDFEVLATMNLNGDYLSDALAAQIGGIGIAPGGNLNAETGHAIFEATHGTAPRFAGRNMVNPSSVILSGELMLRHLGWHEAADRVWQGVKGAIAARTVTFDFARQLEGATEVSTSAFGDAVIRAMAG